MDKGPTFCPGEWESRIEIQGSKLCLCPRETRAAVMDLHAQASGGNIKLVENGDALIRQLSWHNPVLQFDMPSARTDNIAWQLLRVGMLVGPAAAAARARPY